MAKTFSSGDRVEVNFNGEIHMVHVVGIDNDGNILVNGSPRFGTLPMFAGRSKRSSDHEGIIHAAYCFHEEETKPLTPRQESFAQRPLTSERLGNKEETE